MGKVMKVAVVGTSNGIISSSYVSAIKKCFGPQNVRNLSLGASAASFLPFRLNEGVFQEYDLVLIETLVNDAASSRAGGFDSSDLKPLLSWVLERSKVFECEVVGLLIPGRTRDRHLEECYQEAKGVYSEYGNRYFDGLCELNNVCDQTGKSYEELFVDAAHLDSQLCSELVSKFISENEYGVEPYFQSALMRTENHDFVFLPPENKNVAEKSYHVKNSLVDVEVYSYKTNSEVLISFTDEFELWAIVVDSSNTSCYLSIEGIEALSKEFLYIEDARMNKIVVSPTVAKVRSNNGAINLIVCETESQQSERTYQSKDTEVRTGDLNIVGVIAKRIKS